MEILFTKHSFIISAKGNTKVKLLNEVFSSYPNKRTEKYYPEENCISSEWTFSFTTTRKEKECLNRFSYVVDEVFEKLISSLEDTLSTLPNEDVLRTIREENYSTSELWSLSQVNERLNNFIFLGEGLDVVMKDKYGMMYFIISKKDLSSFKKLRRVDERPAGEPCVSQEPYLVQAAKHGALNIIKYIEKTMNSFNFSMTSNTLYGIAKRYNHFDIMKWLTKRKETLKKKKRAAKYLEERKIKNRRARKR